MAQPLVSILINNYNYGRYLAEAIDSALNQTYSPVEVIVVDDGSTDDSAAVLATYADRVQVVQKENGGQASAFNCGFAASQGELICFLDADDWFKPDKVARIVEVFTADATVEWCFHPLEMVDVTGKTHVAEIYQGPSGRYDISTKVQQGKLSGHLPFSGTATSALCFRRSLLTAMLPMPEVIRITSDDYLKYVAWGTVPGYVLLDELTAQRIHGDNAYTHRPDKQDLHANIHLLTAYWLRQNFPVLSPFANKLFAAGIHLYQGFQRAKLLDQPLMQQYLQRTSRRERWAIRLRALYYRYKSV
ncbi:glycosyltransferase family 2 protein [filamentous cyanobacterium LEGE 11480]|uniref:Glycosyltransferase family 2 protein n=1 Tax=Romeriopsis navalis LEGE 11480 TaxID=2777977 RepID=A0A928VLB6_9CYAN|nr:glycosyltransferase family A protein [Romeriopsis navalis]MBE9030420.1 glycosyltransferase family 2 protein [Romeriopsis navalis LEGE 11480]